MEKGNVETLDVNEIKRPEARLQSITETTCHELYGREYFDWKKDVGKFGGRANLFKFSNYISPQDSVVDFGCDGGYLLQNLVCRETLGVEINASARNETVRNGISVVGSIAELPDAHADIIISNHTLEHVANPVETLRSLKDKLRAGGKVVFVVPHQEPHDLKSSYSIQTDQLHPAM